MTNTNTNPFDSFSGTLTAQQAAMALSMAESGDTSFLDDGGAPTPATAAPAQSTEQPAGNAAGANEPAKAGAEPGKDDGATDDNIDPSKAVVLAKDGVHTIPYTKFDAHRKGEQHWKGVAEAQQQELDRLKAEAQARVDAGQAPTKADNMAAQAQAAIDAGVDIGLFGDFSEKALANGIATLIEQRVEAKVGEKLKPLQQAQQKTVEQAHYDAIYKAHADADSIVQSSEFNSWINSQPSVVRDTYRALFDEKAGGTAEQINEVFTAYKGSAQFKGVATPTAASLKDAAAAAIASKDVAPPNSLSSIPGGRADGRSVDDQIGDLTGPAMLAALEGKSVDQVERFLNQRI